MVEKRYKSSGYHRFLSHTENLILVTIESIHLWSSCHQGQSRTFPNLANVNLWKNHDLNCGYIYFLIKSRRLIFELFLFRDLILRQQMVRVLTGWKTCTLCIFWSLELWLRLLLILENNLILQVTNMVFLVLLF